MNAWTDVCAGGVLTVAVVFLNCARVDRRLTIPTGPARDALATVSCDQIIADCVVLTWAGGALVEVNLARAAGVARSAIARVRIDKISADTVVLARKVKAIVIIGGAVFARPSGVAAAPVSVD